MLGIGYGLVMSLALGSIELFVLEGPMRVWLGGLPFIANLMVRSAIYAAIIVVIQWSHFGERIAGVPLAFSIVPSACSPLPSWIIAARSSVMSATR
jgi:hypothetical protein